VAVLTTALISMLLVLLPSEHDRPWAPRTPPVNPALGHELTTNVRWPAEPESPKVVDHARFRDAFAYLCGKQPDSVPADELIDAAGSAGVDPFLLAALVRERSHCETRRSARRGYGLLDIQPDLYLQPGAPLVVERADLAPRALLSAEHNLQVGAQLLRMWMDAHPMLDETFGGVPHRTGVAHFLWGDRVANSGSEDAVFTARRRMLAHYGRQPELPAPSALGIPIMCPLEGTPRLASSGPGEDRDGGLRQHRGLDISASEGEPVRSAADGVVLFAGVNLKGSPRRGPIPPSRIARYRNRRMGAGGIYLCIQHDLGPVTAIRQVVTCYMHLQGYVVASGERVRAGQTIGFVGHTGVHNSPPHLHFEVRVDEQARNPMRYLAGAVIPPKATRTYHHVLAAKRARLRAARTVAPAATGI
jgi:hypothetical protein